MSLKSPTADSRSLAWISWAIASSFVLFQFFLQASAGLMATRWKQDFHLTSTEVGSVSAAFFITYVLLQIPVGLAYDRFGTRRVLIMASLILMLGIFGLACSQNYWQAIIARMLMGAGSGFGFVGMLYATATYFNSRYFALLVGIAETSAMMGVALGEVGMAWLISHFGWRFTLLAAGAVAACIALLVYLFIQDSEKEAPKENKREQAVHQQLFKVLSNPILWFAGLYGFALSAIINVFATLWGVPFIRQQYQPISLHTTSSLISMVFIGIGLGGPIIAWLIQQFDRRILFMRLFSLLTMASLAFILFVPKLSIGWLYLLLLLMGFFSSAYIQTFAVVKDSAEIKYRATALSTANMILMSSPLLLQPAVGRMLFIGYGYPAALSLLIFMLGIAFFLTFFMDSPRRNQPDRPASA